MSRRRRSLGYSRVRAGTQYVRGPIGTERGGDPDVVDVRLTVDALRVHLSSTPTPWPSAARQV
jgi:hypothetical protein